MNPKKTKQAMPENKTVSTPVSDLKASKDSGASDILKLFEAKKVDCGEFLNQCSAMLEWHNDSADFNHFSFTSLNKDISQQRQLSFKSIHDALIHMKSLIDNLAALNTRGLGVATSLIPKIENNVAAIKFYIRKVNSGTLSPAQTQLLIDFVLSVEAFSNNYDKVAFQVMSLKLAKSKAKEPIQELLEEITNLKNHVGEVAIPPEQLEEEKRAFDASTTASTTPSAQSGAPSESSRASLPLTDTDDEHSPATPEDSDIEKGEEDAADEDLVAGAETSVSIQSKIEEKISPIASSSAGSESASPGINPSSPADTGAANTQTDATPENKTEQSDSVESKIAGQEAPPTLDELKARESKLSQSLQRLNAEKAAADAELKSAETQHQTAQTEFTEKESKFKTAASSLHGLGEALKETKEEVDRLSQASTQATAKIKTYEQSITILLETVNAAINTDNGKKGQERWKSVNAMPTNTLLAELAKIQAAEAIFNQVRYPNRNKKSILNRGLPKKTRNKAFDSALGDITAFLKEHKQENFSGLKKNLNAQCELRDSKALGSAQAKLRNMTGRQQELQTTLETAETGKNTAQEELAAAALSLTQAQTKAEKAQKNLSEAQTALRLVKEQIQTAQEQAATAVASYDASRGSFSSSNMTPVVDGETIERGDDSPRLDSSNVNAHYAIQARDAAGNENKRPSRGSNNPLKILGISFLCGFAGGGTLALLNVVPAGLVAFLGLKSGLATAAAVGGLMGLGMLVLAGVVLVGFYLKASHDNGSATVESSDEQDNNPGNNASAVQTPVASSSLGANNQEPDKSSAKQSRRTLLGEARKNSLSLEHDQEASQPSNSNPVNTNTD